MMNVFFHHYIPFATTQGFPCVTQGQEPMNVQTFITQAAVKQTVGYKIHTSPPPDLLQYLFIQAQIGDKFIEPLVLILELSQTPLLRHAQPGKFLLPVVIAGFGYSGLAAHIFDGPASFD